MITKIFDRAYDKAVKGLPLAEMEAKVIKFACENSARLAHKVKKPIHDAVWKQFGWDTPKGEEEWQMIRQRILSPKDSAK